MTDQNFSILFRLKSDQDPKTAVAEVEAVTSVKHLGKLGIFTASVIGEEMRDRVLKVLEGKCENIDVDDLQGGDLELLDEDSGEPDACDAEFLEALETNPEVRRGFTTLFSELEE